MGLIDTLKEVFSNWEKWIIIAIIIAILALIDKLLIGSPEEFELTKLLYFSILGILSTIIAGVYSTAIIKKQQIIDYKEAYNLENFILWLKMIVTQIILSIPILILIIFLVLDIVVTSSLITGGTIETLSTLVVRAFILAIIVTIWAYLTIPAGYITIIKNSIIEGLKNFYKVSLTSKFFIELVKVSLFSILLALILAILGIIPVIGYVLVQIFGFGIGLFAALYLARVIKEIMISKGFA